MDAFKVIYKILKYLETCMDYSEIDVTPIEHEQLEITKEKWTSIMKMVADNGYIEGVEYKTYIHMAKPTITDYSNIRITLRGLEFLNENSTMKKLANLAKGIKEATPFV